MLRDFRRAEGVPDLGWQVSQQEIQGNNRGKTHGIHSMEIKYRSPKRWWGGCVALGFTVSLRSLDIT